MENETKAIHNETEQVRSTIQQKIKENKIVYYGLPFFVIILAFVSIIFFLLPLFEYFPESQTKERYLDQNLITVKNNIDNLNKAYDQEADITNYDSRITTFVPVKAKLGDLINLIQKKADDYSLSRTIGASAPNDNSSLDNLARKGADNKALFESLSSGELAFQPKIFGARNINATLIAINVNVRGSKEAFLNFVKAMNETSPLVNLVSVDYIQAQSGNAESVSATLKFESYALNLDITNPQFKVPNAITNDDPILFLPIQSQTYTVNQKLKEKFPQ